MQRGNKFDSQNTKLLARMTWVLGSKAKFSQKEFQQTYIKLNIFKLQPSSAL
jgi:hypothetical protein